MLDRPVADRTMLASQRRPITDRKTAALDHRMSFCAIESVASQGGAAL